jgi:DNA-binding response OmpR family regulator
MRELVARVKALVRRSEVMPGADGDVFASGDLRVDMSRRQAFRHDEPLPLKPKELELLSFFLRNRGRAFTREQLLSQIWGYDFAGDTRTVDVHVRWLRQKIEEQPDSPSRLVTVRGTGYRFES